MKYYFFLNEIIGTFKIFFGTDFLCYLNFEIK